MPRKLKDGELALRQNKSITLSPEAATVTIENKNLLTIRIPIVPTKDDPSQEAVDNEGILPSDQNILKEIQDVYLKANNAGLFLHTVIKVDGEKGPHAN